MTRETEKAFKILYCEYKRRRRSGMSKQDAVCFEEATISTISAFSKMLRSDITYAMQELKKSDFISMNIWGDIKLLESGIEYMESKPKEYFHSVAEFFDLPSILGIIGSI